MQCRTTRWGRPLNVIAAVFAGAGGRRCYASLHKVIEPHNFGRQFSVLIAIMVIVALRPASGCGAWCGPLMVGITECLLGGLRRFLVGGPDGAYELAAVMASCSRFLCPYFLPEGAVPLVA